MSVTITNTNTSTETPFISRKIEIECYQTAEQKDTEMMDEVDEQMVSVNTTKTTIDEIEEKDGEYNPNDETEPEPESEDVSSDNVSCDNEESEQQESEYENDEEAIVNSKEFEYEFADAIENVRYVSKIDGKRILEKVAQEYIDETGIEATEQQIIDAFHTFTIEPNQAEAEESVSEAEEEEVEVTQSEFAEALESVKKLGKFHQERFVNKLCNTFVELKGSEATVEELTNVFGMIKETFADEAREEFIERNDAESDSDSDYKPTDKDLTTIERDNKCDKKQRIEIVFVDDECDDTESESESEEEESEEESETESEYNDSGVEDAKEDISDDDDDDDDDDYVPGKDTFDYSQDNEDDKQFKTELNGTDENEIECD